MISIKAILVIYANFENGFAWKKTLKTTIQKFFLKSQKFTKKDPVERFRFSRTILFAVQSNFIYDSEAYALPEKCSNKEFYCGPYFPVFGLNTRIYGEISVFIPNTEKYGPEKTLYLDTFHPVIIL